MEDNKQQGENNKLSYEILSKRCEEQDKKIAALVEELEDVKAVVKANFTTGAKMQGEEQVDSKIKKEKFEKRLKEDLGLC